MFQYVIANSHNLYVDLSQKTVDSDLAAAIHILTLAHDHLQGLYDKNNTV
jgi:hypothetical protein